MLECKYIADIVKMIFTEELIDTCWNVNYPGKKALLIVLFELIDTCWNVNELGKLWRFKKEEN